MIDRHQATFLEEARELLGDLEAALLAIEREPENPELINKIFRVMHTIKGSSAMFGFTAIAGFAHELETAFDCVRQGNTRVTPPLITLTLASRDHIALLLDCAELERPPDPAMLEGGERILAKLRTLVPQSGAEQHAEVPAPAQDPEQPAAGPRLVYRIRFKPAQNILLTGSNPQFLIDELKEMGMCEVVEHSDGLPPPEERNPDFCYNHWDLLLATEKDERAIHDVFIFVEDESDIRVEQLAGEDTIDGEMWKELAGELGKSSDVPLTKLKDLLARPRGKRKDASANPQTVQRPGHQEPKAIQNIKVPAERLDKLVDLVGELVTVQARLGQAASTSNDPSMLAISEQVEALVWELRDNAMSMRMLPIGTMFGKFRRLVRDLSSDLNKEIELVTEGEETELDKTVIERLGDPIVHMIRNSLDHGIETPAERIAVGKPKAGELRLSASHVGAFVHITISDDGRGLDTDAICRKALALGLIAPDEKLSEQEMFALIFRPGFSTAREVTSVSGRGVGMDVVRRSIEDLGGQIELTSRPGKGTTVVLKLPLTLAIVEGLLVEVAGDLFVIPLTIVKECVELPEEAQRARGGDLVSVRGTIVPYVRLRRFFEKTATAPPVEYVVIVEVGNLQAGLAVDVVRGQHQTVIKTLGSMYRDVEGVSGATILGDGTVALILDVPAIVADVQSELRV